MKKKKINMLRVSEYSADASTLRDVADGCGSTRPRYCSGGTTTWPGPRVQPPQAEIPSLAAPTPIDTKGTFYRISNTLTSHF